MFIYSTWCYIFLWRAVDATAYQIGHLFASDACSYVSHGLLGSAMWMNLLKFWIVRIQAIQSDIGWLRLTIPTTYHTQRGVVLQDLNDPHVWCWLVLPRLWKARLADSAYNVRVHYFLYWDSVYCDSGWNFLVRSPTVSLESKINVCSLSEFCLRSWKELSVISPFLERRNAS